MKQEYDFSMAVRGKFFREGAELQLPISSTRFAQGQIVCLASDPSVRGAVVEVVPGTAEDRIKVFVDGSIQIYYASQLQADEMPAIIAERDPEKEYPNSRIPSEYLQYKS